MKKEDLRKNLNLVESFLSKTQVCEDTDISDLQHEYDRESSKLLKDIKSFYMYVSTSDELVDNYSDAIKDDITRMIDVLQKLKNIL